MSPNPPAELRERYREMLQSGALRPDPAQAMAVEKLQLLANRIARYRRPTRTDPLSFFTRKRGEVPYGLYIFGGVGGGKTMLMDLFFDSVDIREKRRDHFHAFMAEVHERAAHFRKTAKGDPIEQVAKEIAKDTRLLCFDEFHVTDIADAMILGRLFNVLFETGLVLVATSNVPPRDLYKDGLNRNLFEPFIAELEQRVEVLELSSARDYRLEKLSGSPLYFYPLDEDARARIEALWISLTGTERGEPREIAVAGRCLDVPEAAMGAARFTFADLCEQPLGANDYLALARDFHTIFVEGVPVMGPEKRNEARRFITLIDALYDAGTGLIMTADAEPEALYEAGDGALLFERTVSRLMEMRTSDYLSRGRRLTHS
ncbi:cell division protein ZapE [Dichotomicrobium thermohalophilum]|uniref:Cell division protein ZapE n=1 Tax=Dichotomicrobium thermohalophilum TaxID=933063 RepID=A0A397PFQ6_9HYPH|nr:cell division protein ZapE [Dichotomicrobium thermohalophilum]RIA47293.1 cell division protein ZapE [Dichotomicrobium thermohalophilum]